MKRFILAMALAFALSSTVLAGHIPTSDVAAPTPPPTEPTQTTLAGSTDDDDGTLPVGNSYGSLTMILTILGIVV
jgi:hypothetical protein